MKVYVVDSDFFVDYDYAIENMNIRKTGREYAQVYKDAMNGR